MNHYNMFFIAYIFLMTYILLVIDGVNIYVRHSALKAKKAKELSSKPVYSAHFFNWTSVITSILGAIICLTYALYIIDIFKNGEFIQALEKDLSLNKSALSDILYYIALFAPLLTAAYYLLENLNDGLVNAYLFVNDEELSFSNPGVFKARIKLCEIENVTVLDYYPKNCGIKLFKKIVFSTEKHNYELFGVKNPLEVKNIVEQKIANAKNKA